MAIPQTLKHRSEIGPLDALSAPWTRRTRDFTLLSPWSTSFAERRHSGQFHGGGERKRRQDGTEHVVGHAETSNVFRHVCVLVGKPGRTRHNVLNATAEMTRRVVARSTAATPAPRPPPFPCPCPASTTTTHRLRAFCPFGTTAEISPQCHMREGVRLGAMSWTGLQHESHVVLGNYLAGAAKRTGKRQRGCVLLEKPSWFAGEIDSRQRAWPGRAFNNVCEPRG